MNMTKSNEYNLETGGGGPHDNPVMEKGIEIKTIEGSMKTIDTNTQGQSDKSDITLHMDEPVVQDEGNCRIIGSFMDSISRLCKKYKKVIWIIIKITLFVLYCVYLGFAFSYHFGDEGSWRLIALTVIGILVIAGTLISRFCKEKIRDHYENHAKRCYRSNKGQLFSNVLNWILAIALTVAITVYVIVDILIDHPENLLSVAGICIFIILVYTFSSNRTKINWHPVFWGMMLQLVFALIILRTHWGFMAFKWMGDRVDELIKHTSAGAEFVFGKGYREHYFAFSVLPSVIFISSVFRVLYYLGVLQFIIGYIARFISFCMGTSAGETLNVAASIFLGPVECALAIRPLLPKMTVSEAHAVLVGMFSTASGTLLAVYAGFGVPANQLIAASVMSAPAALAISKVVEPETDVSMTTRKESYYMEKSDDRNIIQAISTGSVDAMKAVVLVTINIISFVCIMDLLDSTLVWFGERIGVEELTFHFACSYVLFPVAYFMGVEVSNCRKVAELIGVRAFVHHIVAYQELGVLFKNKKILNDYMLNFNETDSWSYVKDDIFLVHSNTTLVGGILSDKSEVIATYALCGFANISSLGAILGIVSAIDPSRKSLYNKIITRTLVVGSVASFLTACISGLLFKGNL